MNFQELIPHELLLKALKELGYETPTPIQQQAIPAILGGADIRGSAQTGTGKTAAFILPALCKLLMPPRQESKQQTRGPRVLVLVPTRELAMQVATEATKFSKYLSKIKTVCIYGGAPYPIQNKDLSRPYEILVATPGRLIDHMERGRIDFSRLELLVLDEADRMLDMGFIDPVKHIAAATPKHRQTLLFSATLKGNVLNLSKSLLNDPVEIKVAMDHAKHEKIEQRLHSVDNLDHKYRLLNHLLDDPLMNQAIIFTATKHQADMLVDKLYKDGRPAAALHGNMNQRQRTRTLSQLRQGAIRFLVATDVAARGIDVLTISHVINFDLPMNPEDYVHRIGRTGRAGGTGIALSFVAGRDMQTIRRIEQFTGQPIAPHVIPGMEPQKKMFSPSEHKQKKQAPAAHHRFSKGKHNHHRRAKQFR